MGLTVEQLNESCNRNIIMRNWKYHSPPYGWTG